MREFKKFINYSAIISRDTIKRERKRGRDTAFLQQIKDRTNYVFHLIARCLRSVALFGWKSYLVTLKEDYEFAAVSRGVVHGHEHGGIAWPVTESDVLNTSRPTGHKPRKYARYVA